MHRAVVRGGQVRRRRAPREDPVTRFEVERAEPPRGDPGTAIELAVAPRRGGPVVVAHTECAALAVARHGCVEQIEERSGHRRPPGSSWV